MGKTILLTGAPGSGKTTLIRRIVAQLDRPAGGFYTKEIRERGTRRGFEIVTLDGHRGRLAHVEIRGQPRVSKYGVDLKALDSLAVPAIEGAVAGGGVVVIDEIGPMEILSERFRRALQAAIESEATVLGTIVQRSLPFTDQIKAIPGITLLQVRRDNREALLAQILERLEG